MENGRAAYLLDVFGKKGAVQEPVEWCAGIHDHTSRRLGGSEGLVI